ncbi:MAG: PEP/pyruvate-binding domain-containing protein [Micropruina sp.]|uniref:PEP/pyruvate-binding domain-containing protein n=1 Tax=Micropruina sp. TaxID=2737536 RepID=UPI0039E308B7
MTVPLTLPLSVLRTTDLGIAGGKAVGLGELIAAGLDVPDGFVLTTQAYRRAIAAAGIGPDDQPSPDAVAAVPIPAEVADALRAGYAGLGGGLVAVRSSATAEDLPGAAFAGQQETVLGVLGEAALLDAVRTCWASLWGERAVAYRTAIGVDTTDLALAVVVQRLVEADHAGVMFTANPVSGARDEVVIESSAGLGEAVVSGLVTPDHAVLDESGRVLRRRAGVADVVITAQAGGGTRTSTPAQVPPLSDEALARIAAAGRRIAARTGRPMDVEWAVAGERTVLLQARPMTALPPPARRLNRAQRLAGAVLIELFPRRPTPLELTGWLDQILLPLVDGMFRGMVGMRMDFSEVFFADDAVLREFVPPMPKPTARIPAALAHDLAVVRRDPAAWASDPLARHYDAECRELAGLDLPALPWSELLRVHRRVQAACQDLTRLRVDYLPAAAAAIAQLAGLLTVLGLRGRLATLLTGAVDSRTTTANAELDALAESIREQPVLAEAFGTRPAAAVLDRLRTDPAAAPIADRFQAFLDAYGHRETGGITLVKDPSWADHPETVIDVLGLLLETPSGGGKDAAAPDPLTELVALRRVRALRLDTTLRRLTRAARAGIAAREDTHFDLARLMPPLRHAMIEIGRRLAAHGWLAAPNDIWFLTWPEIAALPDPEHTPVDPAVADNAGRRAAGYAELASAPLIAGASLYPDRGAQHGVLVSGTAGGGGTATGTVRIIHGPDEFGELRAGEVLVCPTTNPSWTPLFTRAAAVVVDHGGIASHAAIVAREYGIPAVMGCGSATATLRTGQQVTVDGDRGVVR